ncbi:MAG: photosystem II reaction center protein PsbN [Bacteroidota bacterium]|nr:photosystem II reaction center protein PsbN [Bacteroidota bacterium]
MATTLLHSNHLNPEAMNKKSAIRHGNNYHEDGIGTVTIFLAIATVAIIFYSIYTAF